ncbi:hypothetical protein Glove_149g56 [Diversispora epigaea]|uniref:Uncharacterized protein n=1 Tax=Diversispora epigaea TaxID=1348612 RepID=A0A397J368_9GLOM|nr:hypothetical protein Glove_149g56 [Diversispora epigaea]
MTTTGNKVNEIAVKLAGNALAIFGVKKVASISEQTALLVWDKAFDTDIPKTYNLIKTLKHVSYFSVITGRTYYKGCIFSFQIVREKYTRRLSDTNFLENGKFFLFMTYANVTRRPNDVNDEESKKHLCKKELRHSTMMPYKNIESMLEKKYVSIFGLSIWYTDGNFTFSANSKTALSNLQSITIIEGFDTEQIDFLKRIFETKLMQLQAEHGEKLDLLMDENHQ